MIYQVSASHDKSLRTWEKTEEPIVLEEEQEMERERKYEESLNKEEQPVRIYSRHLMTMLMFSFYLITGKANKSLLTRPGDLRVRTAKS